MSSISEIWSRIRRRSLQSVNRLLPSDRAKVAELMALLEQAPVAKAGLAEWMARVQPLVHQLVLTRITKEDLALILTGLISYQRTGITPEIAHLSLVRAFESTSGLFQEVMHRALFASFESPLAPVQSGLFGTFSPERVDYLVATMQRDGYVVLDSTFDQDIVEHLRAEALLLSYELKGGDEAGRHDVKIDPNAPPRCISAYAEPRSKHDSHALRMIADDALFTRVASQYLGCSATAIDMTLWYTFPHSTPSSDTAQLFHYDLDTIRWVKVFIYLSDVGDENGPHEYVATSHRPENKEPGVLMRNYGRIDDSDIDGNYPGMRRRVTGRSGTVIIGDTRCFHKGNSVSRGYRLMFSPIYAPSRVGYFHG
jgi:hypothetical protein